jgi:HEAT repeat protein
MMPAGQGEEGFDEALRSQDPVRRANAILSAPEGSDLERILVLHLGDPSPSVRVACVRRLVASHGPRGVRALIRSAAQDPSPTVRGEAIAALGRIMEARTRSDPPRPAAQP